MTNDNEPGAPETRDPVGAGSEKSKQSFSVWLTSITKAGGIDSAQELQKLLLQHDCHCTLEDAANWLQGAAEPSYEKTRDIIKSLYDALPQIEVWREYRRFVEGKPFLEEQTGLASEVTATLEAIAKQGGLPPPLA